MKKENIQELKAELKKRKRDFVLPEATNKAQYLALVEINWLKKLISWIKSDEAEMPGKIPNHLLCNNRKFDPNKRAGHDFSGISVELYDQLSEIFKGGPKIVRPFTRSAETGKPTFIKSPITLLINYNDHVYKKVVDPKWSVASVLNYFCSAIKVNNSISNFTSTDNSKVIDKSLTIEEATHLYSTTFSLHVNESQPTELNPINPPKMTKNYRGIKSNDTALNSSLQVLVRIPPLSDFIKSENHNNHIITNPILIKQFIALSQDLLSDDTALISVDTFKQILSNKYPLIFRKTTDPFPYINSIIESLSDDTNNNENDSPISSIFCGTLHVIIECSICNNFFSSKKHFFVLTLKIPEIDNEETLLSDCIAHSAASVQPDQSLRFKCPSCGISCCPFQVETVENAAEVLIIHLERNFGNENVITKKVSFPDEIDLSSFSSIGVGIYQLFGVIYMDENKCFNAAVLDNDIGKWIEFSNEKCNEISEQDVHQKNASVLFFQKS